MAQLEYCIYEGSIKHISEVLSGLNNNSYKCPICGEPLVAKKGSIVGHHFSHLPNSTCSAATYVHGETNLHLGLKKIMQETCLCRMPELDVDWEGNLVASTENTLSYIRLKESGFYPFSKWDIEKKIDCSDGNYIRPDFTCYDVHYMERFGFPTTPCSVYVEVTVTHGIDDFKLNLIKSLSSENFYVVEYDLSDISRDISYNELKNAYLHGSIPCRWVHRNGKIDPVKDKSFQYHFRITNSIKWHINKYYKNLSNTELIYLKGTNKKEYEEQIRYRRIIEDPSFNNLNLTKEWNFFKENFPRTVFTALNFQCPQYRGRIREKAPAMIQCMVCKHCKHITYQNGRNLMSNPRFVILCSDMKDYTKYNYKVVEKDS